MRLSLRKKDVRKGLCCCSIFLNSVSLYHPMHTDCTVNSVAARSNSAGTWHADRFKIMSMVTSIYPAVLTDNLCDGALEPQVYTCQDSFSSGGEKKEKTANKSTLRFPLSCSRSCIPLFARECTVYYYYNVLVERQETSCYYVSTRAA